MDDDRDDAYNKVAIARALQHLNGLRANSRAGDRSHGHDQPQTKVDVSQRAVPSYRHHGFSDDVRQIGADCEIPVQTGEAQCRPRDETSTPSEESAKNADDKSGGRQIDGTDVRA